MTWNTIPLKRIVTFTAGGTPPVDQPDYWADIDDGYPWVAISDMSSVDSVTTTARRISADGLRAARINVGKPGTILFSMYASLGHTAWLAAPSAWNQAILGLWPDPTTDARFLRYCLVSIRPQLLEQVRSNTQANLNAEVVGNLRLPYPPIEEQRRIANFLDAETARINELSATYETQASVLEELELARIGEHLSAIETKGPVYAYFDVQLGKMLNAERAAGDNQQPYLRNANVQWYEINTGDMATMEFEPYERLRYGLRAGDLLVCEGGHVGRSAVWDGRIEGCFYQKSLHRVRARGQVPVDWLMYCLRYANSIGVFEAEGNLTTIAHLTGEQLAGYRIPIPEDGGRRVCELSSEIAAIREMRRKIAAASELLAERTQALITAVVTGRISV